MRLLRWLMLIVGIAMVLLFVLFLASAAAILAPFGAIPAIWQVVNVGWAALLACGLLLIGSSALLFRRASKLKWQRRLGEFD